MPPTHSTPQVRHAERDGKGGGRGGPPDTTRIAGWGTAQERAAAEAVRVLVWLCRRTETRALWAEYFDLILLKLINAYGASSKEVMRAVDAGMTHIAHALPAAQVLNTWTTLEL